jgi:hypothetical protein
MQWLRTLTELLLVFTLGPVCWFCLGTVFGALADWFLHFLLEREPAESMYHVTNGLAAVTTLGLVLWLT